MLLAQGCCYTVACDIHDLSCNKCDCSWRLACYPLTQSVLQPGVCFAYNELYLHLCYTLHERYTCGLLFVLSRSCYSSLLRERRVTSRDDPCAAREQDPTSNMHGWRTPFALNNRWRLVKDVTVSTRGNHDLQSTAVEILLCDAYVIPPPPLPVGPFSSFSLLSFSPSFSLSHLGVLSFRQSHILGFAVDKNRDVKPTGLVPPQNFRSSSSAREQGGEEGA